MPVSGQFHLVGGGHPVGRAGAARRDVHLAARRAALAEQAALGQPAQVTALPGRGGVLVAQPDRRRDHGHRLAGLGRPGLACAGLACTGLACTGLACTGAVGRSAGVARLEAGDVLDAAGRAGRPAWPHPQPGVQRRGRPSVHRVQHGRVRAVQPDQRPAERVGQRLPVQRVRYPGPAEDGAFRADLDQIARRVAGIRVILERRGVHPPIGPRAPRIRWPASAVMNWLSTGPSERV